MSRYEPLAQFLDRSQKNIWKAEFEEVEAVLGFPLPQSAYRYPAWWANQRGAGHSQTSGWRDVGWKTSKVDLKKQQIIFERVETRVETQVDAELSNARDDFAVRGAIEFLIGLGGTMPNYRPAPRT